MTTENKTRATKRKHPDEKDEFARGCSEKK